MFKKLTMLTALALIGTSASFGVTLNADTVEKSEQPSVRALVDPGVYDGAEVIYNSTKTCPSSQIDKHHKDFKGGTIYYGCYKGTSGIKPYTEYKKETGQDYQAITKTPSGTGYGTVKDGGAVSAHAEYTIKSTGTVTHKVKFSE